MNANEFTEFITTYLPIQYRKKRIIITKDICWII